MAALMRGIRIGEVERVVTEPNQAVLENSALNYAELVRPRWSSGRPEWPLLSRCT